MNNSWKFTTLDWAKIRAMYESGEYRGYTELHEKCTKLFEKCPSESSMRHRGARDKWDKNLKEPEYIEAQHEKFIRLAREMNMDELYLLTKIKEMIDADDKGVRNNGIQRFFDLTGFKAPTKIAKTDVEGQSVTDTVFMLPANGFEPSN